MTPEEKARVKIDRWFADAGWLVVNRLGLLVFWRISYSQNAWF